MRSGVFELFGAACCWLACSSTFGAFRFRRGVRLGNSPVCELESFQLFEDREDDAAFRKGMDP
jgi:hypothetical protein